METPKIQVWLGKTWPHGEQRVLLLRIGLYCDFVDDLEDAEIALVKDGTEISDLGDTSSSNFICLCLEKPYHVKDRHAQAIKLDSIRSTFELMFEHAKARAAIAASRAIT